MARNVVFAFMALFIAALIGFWPTYFTRIGEMAAWTIHVHGVVLFGWCLLLIAQAGLMRAGRRDTHRALGKVSYVWMPLVLFTSLYVEIHLLRRGGPLNEEALFFAYLIPALVVQMGTAWGLGIRHRANAALHSRYMIASALPLIDPIFARIFGVYLEMPFGVAQVFTFFMADSILLWLAWRDRKSGIRVYAWMMVLFVALQLPAFWMYQNPTWAGIVRVVAGQ